MINLKGLNDESRQQNLKDLTSQLVNDIHGVQCVQDEMTVEKSG